MKHSIVMIAGVLASIGVGVSGAMASASAERPDLRVLAVTGEDAPSLDGATLGSFLSWPRINNNGLVTFSSDIDGSTISSREDRGVFRYGVRSRRLLAQDGDDAGTRNGSYLINVGPAHIADTGAVLASAAIVLDRPGLTFQNLDGVALYTLKNGQRTLIVREGDNAPVAENEAPIANFFDAFVRQGSFSINDNEVVSFFANFAGDRRCYYENTGIFQADELGLRKILRGDDIAPGSGGRHLRPSDLSVAFGCGSATSTDTPAFLELGNMLDDGTQIYVGSLNFDEDPDTFGSEAITALMTVRGNDGEVLAVQDDPIPSDPAFRYFTFRNPTINENGSVIFEGLILNNRDEVQSAIVRLSGTDSEILLKSGDPAPGTPGGTIDFTDSFDGFSLNANGDAVIRASYEKADGDDGRGVYFAPGNGDPIELIAAVGDEIEISEGKIRTLSALRVSRQALNDGGQIVMSVDLTNDADNGVGERVSAILMAGPPNVFPEADNIDIDVIPFNEANRFRAGKFDRILVAILSTETFDAPSAIDQSTVRFGLRGEEASPLTDCYSAIANDGDNLRDLVCRFRVGDTGITRSAKQARLTAERIDGGAISGSDAINPR